VKNIFGPAKGFFLKSAVNFLPLLLRNNSDESLFRVFRVLSSFVAHEKGIVWLFEKDHSLLHFFKRIVNELNANYRYRYIVNRYFVWNSLGSIRASFERNESLSPPENITFDVTSRCNLRCEGCWAGEYSKTKDLDAKLIMKILDEARYKMGINYFAVTGGEPFLRKDLLGILGKYIDCSFTVYTNGVSISDDTIRKLADLGNIWVLFSLEGNEERTDRRRGRGVYKKIMETMDKMKKAGVLFGFSVMPVRDNIDYLGGDEFIDAMIAKGCMWGAYFSYIPVGTDPNTDLMPTPQQRNKLRYSQYRHRNTKPIFLFDFWNDGPEVGGCMAGGRKFVHITNDGDIEPCVFIHFAVGNIKEMTLTESMKTPFFTAIRKAPPYEGNLLRPCMVIDRPDVLRDLVDKFDPYSTHDGAKLLFTRCRESLNKYSKELAEILDKEWAEGRWMKIYPTPDRPQIVGVDDRLMDRK